MRRVDICGGGGGEVSGVITNWDYFGVLLLKVNKHNEIFFLGGGVRGVTKFLACA